MRATFTVVELLTAVAVIVLLTALLVPALSNARARAACVHCLSNLRSIAVASLAYSMEDAHSLLIPAHPTADYNQLYDDGYFDFGGASGSGEMWDGTRVGPQSQRRADTRPLNRCLGLARGSADDYAVYACPRDVGFDPPGIDFATIVWEPRFREHPVADLVGTSYWGNAPKGRSFGPQGPHGPKVSIGPWLRSATRVPQPCETVLYCEMPVAFNLVAFRTYAPRGWQFGFYGLAGWHGGAPASNLDLPDLRPDGTPGSGEPARFNLAFCDGSARTLELAPACLGRFCGPEYPMRISGIRFDCYPDRPIVDLPITQGSADSPARTGD